MNLDYPNPFIIKIEVKETDIDELGHANNKAYLDWSMEAAWRHSDTLGLKPEDYIAMDCAMVARRHALIYLVPTFEGAQLSLRDRSRELDESKFVYQKHRVTEHSKLGLH